MENKRKKRRLWFEMAYASTLGIGLVVTIFGCLFIGILIDRKLGTRNIFTTLFLVLGVFAGFRNFYVFIKKYMKEDKKSGDKTDRESRSSNDSSKEN
ncbi:MAG TPA: AtpZ/AtpI family protein [Deltaproteobacteria bacterium]|nr:AtpZ/AtpI family protein [Deltaproteobacteria bacterium]